MSEQNDIGAFGRDDKDLVGVVGGVEVRIDYDDVDHKKAEKVARLISAAPKMLKVLKQVQLDCSRPDLKTDDDRIMEIMTNVRAILSKLK